MKTFFSILFLILINGQVAAQPKPLEPVNTKRQEYGSVLRYTSNGAEIWYTATNGGDASRSRQLMRARWNASGIETPEPADAPLNGPASTRDSIPLDGSPAFGCDPDYMVFVTNRLVEGKSHGNDLYEARYDGSAWHVTRLDAVCSNYWDDTPALSWDGSTLYFTSDRRKPNQGLSDIYVSTRTSGGWNEPRRLTGLTSDPDRFAVETPFYARDGFLYYSSNETSEHNFAIRRVHVDSSTKMPDGTPDSVNVLGLNLPFSDAGHPWVSPGGHWLIFSSNRDTAGKKDFDIYVTSYPNNPKQATLNLSVVERTHAYDSVNQRWIDVLLSEPSRVFCPPLTSPSLTNDQGKVTLAIPHPYSKSPIDDLPFVSIYLRAETVRPTPNLISSSDRLIVDASSSSDYSYTLYLWDTAVYYSHECNTDFRVRDIPFFVRGYWCPTTLRYGKCLSCASVFLDSSCIRIEDPKPQLPCKPSDDLRVYQLDYRAPTVEVRQPEGLCINHEEWHDSSASYAKRVDSVLNLYIEEMKSVFSKEVWCVERAIERGDTVRIEVIGWTDPGSLLEDCLYTGSNIDLNDNSILLTDMGEKKYIQNGTIHHGVNFLKTSKLGTGGNELLADLRAYYTARLLDSLWSVKIPRY